MLRPRDSVRLVTGLLAACLVLACASPPQSTEQYELTIHEWSEIQTLAIVPGSEATEVTLWALNAKKGAAVGVMQAVKVANILTLGLWPLAFYGAGAVCVPALGAGVGAAVGAIRKPSDDDLERTRQLLFDVITPACLPQLIQNDLIDAGAAHAAARQIVSLDALEGRTAQDRVPSLRDRGIDAVLEVTLDSIEVSGPWGTNPEGALRVLARYQLISTLAGSVIVQGSQLETVGRQLIEGWWIEPNEANLDPTSGLREQLFAATKAAAQKIAEGVFLKHPFAYPKPEPASESNDELAPSRP